MAKTGLPVTLRMRGFDVTTDSFRALLENEWLRGVYAFPAQLALLRTPDARVRTVPAAFDTALFRPGHLKDHRLVVRAGSALKAKDIGFVFALAKRLPEFRFIYAGITCKHVEPYVEEGQESRRGARFRALCRHDGLSDDLRGLAPNRGRSAVAASPDSGVTLP